MWFLYALSAAVCMGIYSLLVRRLLQKNGDFIAFTFILEVTTAILILPLSLLENRFFHLDLKILLTILALTLVYALVDILFVRARQLEDASTIAVVMRVGSVWALVNGSIFLHEALTTQKLFGVALIIMGGLLAVWQKTKLRLTPGVLMIVGGSLLFSLGSLVDKHIVTSTISPGLYRPITWILASFWVLAYMRFDLARVKREYLLHGPKIFFVTIFISLYSYLALVSYRYGEISKAAPVISLSTIFTVAGAIIFLGENGNKWRKLLGAIIAIVGALILR